jgi:hypothetical protein
MPISLLGKKVKSVASLRPDRHDVERLIGMSVERPIGFNGIRTFVKKTQATPRSDLAIARKRMKEVGDAQN